MQPFTDDEVAECGFDFSSRSRALGSLEARLAEIMRFLTEPPPGRWAALVA